jgi:hypothetical protein
LRSSIDEVFAEQQLEAPRLLHILNGDSVRATIENSGIPGTFCVWADALHDGPVPATKSVEELRAVRAAFWARKDWRPGQEDPASRLKGWDEGLASFNNYDEALIWLEHDLFDQLLLIHHLDFLSRRRNGNRKLSLICIGEYPGLDRFIGLGQLNAEQLASLLGTRQTITDAQLALGRAAWEAFRSPDPIGLQQIVRRDTSALPFLEAALVRFLEEYPSKPNGLPRTERQILTVLEDGPRSPVELFRAMYALEEAVYMGDLTFWLRVKDLAIGEAPLVELDVAERGDFLPSGQVQITDAGRRVLDGRQDWISLNGIDRWLGGVYLHGRQVPWRWDESARSLVVEA